MEICTCCISLQANIIIWPQTSPQSQLFFLFALPFEKQNKFLSHIEAMVMAQRTNNAQKLCCKRAFIVTA